MTKREERTIDDDLLSYWNGRVMSNIGNGDFDSPVEETEETYRHFVEKAHETANESDARLEQMEFMRTQGHRFSKYTNSVSRNVALAFEQAAGRILAWDREGAEIMPVERLTTVTNARSRLVQFMQRQRGKASAARTSA